MQMLGYNENGDAVRSETLPIFESGEVNDMPLEKELATYNQSLPMLMESVGKFVLICGDDVAGVYDTYDDALKIGYEKFGLQPFLVKQIATVDRVHFFTRNITGCHI